jgi:hypothetical protein
MRRRGAQALLLLGCFTGAAGAAARSASGFQHRASWGAAPEPAAADEPRLMKRALRAKGALCDGDARDAQGQYIQGQYHASSNNCRCASVTHPT